ncbi:SPARC-related modular calcium-binding protein 1 [Chelonia mydas]|uniref:SPARC-related modular calcium-binding protein 1 n=1 Tax=Chelonia mydas TaxID=8469 RepID=M7C8K5_CHEMY|nr:SPARC-related modular calcium-binding protein 1 [Chelonia mydas]
MAFTENSLLKENGTWKAVEFGGGGIFGWEGIFPQFLISDRDRDPQCNLHCSRSQSKPLCASDGRTYESMCDYQRAKCRDSGLSVVHRGRCKDAGQSKCRLERAQALEQAKKPQEAVFIPECNEDGSFTQVQCHTYTGYCWCVTPDGKPISGSSVQNKTPVCSAPWLIGMQTCSERCTEDGKFTDMVTPFGVHGCCSTSSSPRAWMSRFSTTFYSKGEKVSGLQQCLETL